MLTVQLARGGGEAWTLVQPPTFHTLTTRPSAHTHVDHITALGLVVRPSAAACLLGATCGVVTNHVLPWGVLVGASEAARLADDMTAIRSETVGLHCLLASFNRAMRSVVDWGRWQQTERLCELVGQRGAQAVGRIGIGSRQLERRCQAVLGVSPKQLQRLERFHRVLSAAVAPVASPWAEMALEAGYCDQSHLALEARRLGGASVREMAAQAVPGAPWWALATPSVARTALGYPSL